MFKFIGKQNFVIEESHALRTRKEAVGWLWQDYHQNRQLYIRPLGRGKYQLAIFVNGVRTTDEITTQTKIQSYTQNNMNFAIDDSTFAAIK